MAAPLALGAAAAQVGTVFLRTRQSAASEAHRRAIGAVPAHGTVPDPGDERTAGARRDEGELVSLWAGQAAPLARFTGAGDVFAELAAGAR